MTYIFLGGVLRNVFYVRFVLHEIRESGMEARVRSLRRPHSVLEAEIRVHGNNQYI
jgi:hypothetical protein